MSEETVPIAWLRAGARAARGGNNQYSVLAPGCSILSADGGWLDSGHGSITVVVSHLTPPGAGGHLAHGRPGGGGGGGLCEGGRRWWRWCVVWPLCSVGSLPDLEILRDSGQPGPATADLRLEWSGANTEWTQPGYINCYHPSPPLPCLTSPSQHYTSHCLEILITT